MANTLCSFIPFLQVVHLFGFDDYNEGHDLLRVLLFCRKFSKVKAPDEIRLGASSYVPAVFESIENRDLASLPNLKSLDFSDCDMDVELAHELFQSLQDSASLTQLVLPDAPKMTDWGILAKALTTSKTLQAVTCILLGERGEGGVRALDAGLCSDTPLASVGLTICGPMSETALQALENLLLNKSLSSVSVTVKGDISHSLAVTLSRALAGQTAVKSLELRVNGKLSFCCANLIQQGIVKNNSLSNLVFSLRGERPDYWQAIVESLNERLTEKSTVTFAIYPNTFSQVNCLTLFPPCMRNYEFFEQKSVTLNVWGELTVDGAEALYNFLPYTSLCHLTLNIHGKLTDHFLHCTARHVEKQKPLCPITINTWDQLTNEGKALLKELELDKNPAVTLNVCDVHVPSDESGDNEIVSIDNPASLIALLERAENTGKENLTVTINVQSNDSTCDDSDDFTCDDSDDSTGRSWNDGLHLRLPRNCSLNSLTLTINNFSPKSTGLSLTLIGCLESCISLKSLTLTLNEYNELKSTYVSLLHEGLARNTSLISLTLTLNFYTRIVDYSSLRFRGYSFVPNTSINSFTLTTNDFSISGCRALDSIFPWPNYKYLTTLNLTFNRYSEVHLALPDFFIEARKVNSLRTLRLKIDHSELILWNGYPEDYFRKWVLESPSLELIELSPVMDSSGVH